MTDYPGSTDTPACLADPDRLAEDADRIGVMLDGMERNGLSDVLRREIATLARAQQVLRWLSRERRS